MFPYYLFHILLIFSHFGRNTNLGLHYTTNLHTYHLQNNAFPYYLSHNLLIFFHFGKNTILDHHYTTNSLVYYLHSILHSHNLLLVLCSLQKLLSHLYNLYSLFFHSHIFHLQNNVFPRHLFHILLASYRFEKNTTLVRHCTTSSHISHYKNSVFRYYLFHILLTSCHF